MHRTIRQLGQTRVRTMWLGR